MSRESSRDNKNRELQRETWEVEPGRDREDEPSRDQEDAPRRNLGGPGG